MSSKIFGTKVKLPTFKVVTMPTITIADVKQTRFNIIDRYNSVNRELSITVLNIIGGVK